MSRSWMGLLPVGVALALGGWLTLSTEDAEPLLDPAPERRCGVGLGLFASTPDYDYGPLLAEVADHGATDVLLSVPWVQRDITADHLGPVDGQSPGPATVARTIDQARALGLDVTLMPVVRLEERGEGTWRGALAPTDPDAWFAAYGDLLVHHAELAQAHGAVRLVLGSELTSLEGEVARWTPLVAAVRQRFSGTLTWSANWDRFQEFPFWDQLDEVGVSAWFELGDDPEAAWQDPKARLRRVAAETGKPVVLTEVGYPARATAADRPWDHAGPAPVDVDIQARLFRVFFRQFRAESRVTAVFVWNWFGLGGYADAGYSPRGRPAAGVIKRAYADWCGGQR